MGTMLNHTIRFHGSQAVLLSAVGWIASLLSAPIALAQNPIAPDGTLGAETSTVAPLAPGILPDDFERIDGGAVRGQNLFHSFSEFNINEMGGAYFITPSVDIANIFARVTGGNTSNILGILGTLDNNFLVTSADLFLINPNGIIFGENAALNVGSSFTATTASGVQFGEDERFSAVDPSAPSALLTINPSAYFFSQPSTAQIINQSVWQDPINGANLGLRVPDGEALTLLGGSVIIQGGNLTAHGGIVELGAVGGAGQVNLNVNRELSFPAVIERGAITVSAGANILSIAGNGGAITFTGGNVDILDSSVVGVGMVGGAGNESSQLGDLIIQATGDLVVDGGSLVTNQVLVGGVGNAGSLRITTANLRVTQSRILVGTFGTGNAGNLLVNAQNNILIEDGGGVFNIVKDGAIGTGGDIILTSENLEISNGSRLEASTDGQGNAGRVDLRIQDILLLDGSEANSFISNDILQNGEGNTGGIEISVGSIFVVNGSQITAQVRGAGNTGNVSILAQGDIVFDGRDDLPNGVFIPSAIFTGIAQGGAGNSGNIQIAGKNFSVVNRAQIVSATQGSGDAGDIIVRAQNNIYLLNSIITSGVTEGTGNGEGGDIILEAKVVELVDGSSLLAGTENIGNAGSIIIRASERVTLSGEGPGANNSAFIVPSQITTTVDGQNARGEGGDIDIATGILSLTDRAFISSSTSGDGTAGDTRIQVDSLRVTGGAAILAITRSAEDAGTIFVTANDEIFINGRDARGEPSEIASSSIGEATGNGGAVFIASPSVFLADGGRISATSGGSGLAGDINFDINRMEVSDGTIETSAVQSQGGDINVNAASGRPRGVIVLRGDGDITTDGFGNGGNINLNTIVIAFDDSDILARSTDARGGNITLGPFFSDTLPIGAVFPTENNGRVDVSADGRLASGTITTPDTSFVQNSLNQLPAVIVDPSTLIAGSCIARTDEGQGTFVDTGSGGLPHRPGDAAISAYPTGNVQPLPSVEHQAVWQPGDPIVEPTGAFALPDGRLVLSRRCDDN